ncbi:MAG TPA: DUF3341 domain-containing protein [Tepidisphaeraceae bacterium]|nr:DUF3341 domain-containing protein [Tepidisphaeraceae bacterium]
MPKEDKIYGLMAEFEMPEHVLEAGKRTHDAGYRKIDAYTPFPVHGLDEAVGYHRSKLPYIILAGALIGMFGGFFMQYVANVIHFPINIGGRPYDSWVAFIPITFELTILCGGLTAIFAMIALNGLPMPFHPVFNVPRFERASQDRFFLCIEAEDPQFDLEKTKQFLQSMKPYDVYVVPYGRVPEVDQEELTQRPK